MKIIISSTGTDLDAEVEPRFGRAQQFLLVDLDSDGFEVIDNGQDTGAVSGAGIQTAEMVANTGAEIVITGHCGPKAFRALSAAGIKIITGAEGKVSDILDRLKNKGYEFAEQPDVQGHW